MDSGTPSIYWHDYETFGADPRRDWPAQFAGVRTDLRLNIIGEPLVIYCQPPKDCLPHPQACLITGISPQLAAAKGLKEPEFIRRIHKVFSQANTCVSGYNNIRFDDEVTRNTLYRNFYDPYSREWQNGNSRWDIIDVVRMTHALRPDDINWPKNDEGYTSFRLELLTAANDISHEGAHDALSDVTATIDLAKLIRSKQERLFDFCFDLKSKKKVGEYLNLFNKKALVHVSSKFPAKQNCLALVFPLAVDQINNNAIHCYDLSKDPNLLLDQDADTIKKLLFTPQSEFPENKERIHLKSIHINKCPMIAPTNVLRPEDIERLELDMSVVEKNLKTLNSDSALKEIKRKLIDVFNNDHLPLESDPDLMIYSGGFFSKSDREKMNDFSTMDSNQLEQAQHNLNFQDKRIPEMLFRYRARNYPESLSEEEVAEWRNFRKDKLKNKTGAASLSVAEFEKVISELSTQELDKEKIDLLNLLVEYKDALVAELN